MRVHAGALAYVSESYDGDQHFLNATFLVEVVSVSSFDCAQDDTGRRQDDTGRRQDDTGRRQDDTGPGDHVVAVEWVTLDAVSERIAVRVVREPLVAYLEGRSERRYTGYHDAGITIEWPADSL